MAPRTVQSRLECETTIIWNELDEQATLWTASPSVRRDWESHGFPVQVYGGGWGAVVPKDRIAYKTVRPSNLKGALPSNHRETTPKG